MSTKTPTKRRRQFGFILIFIVVFFMNDIKLLLNVVVDEDNTNVIIDDFPAERNIDGRRIATTTTRSTNRVGFTNKVPESSSTVAAVDVAEGSSSGIVCRSQFHISSPSNEQSPILFRKDQGNLAANDLLICRCPKVGSTMLRRILNSYYYNVNALTLNHTTTTTTRPAEVVNFKLANDKRYRPIPPKEEWLLGYTNMTIKEFRYWTLTNNSRVSRIAFVRHPVMRIVSGYYEICYNVRDELYKKYLKERGAFDGMMKELYQRQQNQKQVQLLSIDDVNSNSSINIHKQQREDYIQMFKLFMNHPNLFLKDYQSDCGSHNSSDSNIQIGSGSGSKHKRKQQNQQYDPSKIARKPLVQHWAPGQHCRCGMNDCSIQYDVYPIEKILSVQSILRSYLFDDEQKHVPSWFPPDSIVSNSRKASLIDSTSSRGGGTRKSSFYDHFLYDVLSDNEILSKLNDITKIEQDYFGYMPLTIQNIQNGYTVGFIKESY